MVGVVIVIVIAFFIQIGCYIYISNIEGSYVNMLFPYVLTTMPVNFFLEPLYLYIYGLPSSSYAYIYIYICHACIMLFTTIGYTLIGRDRVLELPFSFPKTSGSSVAFFLLGVSVLIYLPVLIEFRQYIFHPRAIYTATRTGYGLYFFMSTFFCLIGYLLFLFSKRKSWLRTVMVTIFVILFLYLHGSKGQVLLILSMAMLYYVYVKKWSVSLKQLSVFIPIISGGVVVLFILTANYEYDNILALIVRYADYNRNAAIIIDHSSKSYNYEGQLTFESNYYSRIPRAIMPNKPKDYGVFRLAKKYFPAWYYADTGAPNFGVGVQYADFGGWAVFYLSFWAMITGLLMKVFANRLRYFKTPGDLIVLLFLAGITLLETGDGYLLPEHLVVALFINMLLSVEI